MIFLVDYASIDLRADTRHTHVLVVHSLKSVHLSRWSRKPHDRELRNRAWTHGNFGQLLPMQLVFENPLRDQRSIIS